MPKTKISEFSATPGNNTDIDGINIAEGCAPSGINDAIRELMSQLKDFQTGAAGDSFNGPVGTTTAAAGAFTTLSASGAVTLSGGTANGVAYLNGSKVLTTGSALTFDGTNLGVGAGSAVENYIAVNAATFAWQRFRIGGTDRGYIGTPNSFLTGGAGTDFGVSAINNLVFGIGSSEQMRLTSTGLGIGTSSPSQKLHAYGNIEFGGASAPFLYSHRNAVISSAVSLGQIEFAGDTSGSALNLAASIRAYADGAWTDSSFPANLRFYTVSSGSTSEVERMRLDSSGNLGLGVTPSASNLPTIQSAFGIVSGNSQTNIAANAYYNNQWLYTSTAVASLYTQTSGQHRWYTAPSGTAGNAISFTQAMTLDASGNLGVGTTSPQATIVAAGSSATVYKAMILRNGSGTDGSSATIDFETSAGTQGSEAAMAGRIAGLRTGSGTSGALTFSTTNGGTLSERARIDSSGNFISTAPTTAPTLSTNGTMVFNLTSNTNLRISVRGSDGVTRTANITLA